MNEADSEVKAAGSAHDGPERAPSNGVLLAAVGALWMAGMLWSARATITGRADAEMEVTSTAYAMPGAVSASLVAGAAVALAVLALLARAGRTPGVTVRFALATGTGLCIGALGALSIITINTEGWLYAVVGGTVAAAATIGGALAGLRNTRVTAAACWGAVAVFVVGVVLSFLQDSLLPALGAGDTAESQARRGRLVQPAPVRPGRPGGRRRGLPRAAPGPRPQRRGRRLAAVRPRRRGAGPAADGRRGADPHGRRPRARAG
nr:hypothetical protein GCM10020092_096740 [Actinoplanes digitatis]